MRFSKVNKSKFDEEQNIRIDSEFWDTRLIQNEDFVNHDLLLKDLVIDKNKIRTIQEQSKLSDEERSSIEYLEIGDVDISSMQYRTKTITHPSLIPSRATYLLRPGDVAVSMVRPIRNAAALVDDKNIVASSGFTVLRPLNIEPEYLWVFCKTKYFKDYLFRRQRNSMYPAVRYSDIAHVPMVLAPRNIRAQICRNIRRSIDDMVYESSEYKSAKIGLLEKLGVLNENKTPPNQFVSNLSTIVDSNRIDAKYFSPRFDILNAAFKNCERTVALKDVARIRKGVEVGSENYVNVGIPFVRVSDVDLYRLNRNKMVSKEVFDEFAESRVRKGEVLLTKDATIGSVHYVDYKPESMLISSGIIALRICSNSLPAQYLALVLDTAVTSLQIERESSGSNISHWNLQRVQDLTIPLLSNAEMDSFETRLSSISRNIAASRRATYDSIDLLDDYIDSQRAA